MKLCIIPARAGSKRIPRKNIRDFCGRPIIAWSIAAAEASRCFDRIVVSTDDTEIADIAQYWGAEVPFMRPSELADDYTGTGSVMAHAVNWFNERRHQLTEVCCLYATAPFVRASDIVEGLDLLQHVPDLRFVFAGTAYPFPIQRAFALDRSSGEAHMLYPEEFSKRSQDLQPAYHDAGQFYWGRPQAWLSYDNLFEGGKPILIPKWRVQDIDEEEDWIRAELMWKTLSIDFTAA